MKIQLTAEITLPTTMIRHVKYFMSEKTVKNMHVTVGKQSYWLDKGFGGITLGVTKDRITYFIKDQKVFRGIYDL